MKVIVGLGNIGEKYENTRHNLGFFIVDRFLSKFSGYVEQNRFSSYFYLLPMENRASVCKPKTFMNLSGISMEKIKSFYKLKNEDFLVVHDDLYIPTGEFKLSFGKGSGGHNGLKSVHDHMSGKNIYTLRIGIGPRERADSIAEYVMQKLPREDYLQIDAKVSQILEAISNWLNS